MAIDQKHRTLARRAVQLLSLWLGFWLLALGLVMGLLWIPFAQMFYRDTLDFSGIIAGLAALTLAWSLRPRGKGDAKTAGKAVALDPKTGAQLYAMVEQIGQPLGITAPVNIHLIGAATAFISASRDWRGRVKALDVGLGLPLLGTLSKDELGSVIAHEFGHFFAGDLSLGPWVYRTRASLGNTIADLDDSIFFFDIVFRWYGKWFLRQSAALSREQEYAADALAARCFGTRATRAALEKIHLIDPVWSAYLDHELGPAINRGAHVPIFDGFRRFCKPGQRRPEVATSIERAQHQPTEAYDSHPSLEDRVGALVSGARPVYPPLSACFDLLGGESATEQAWYASIQAQDLVPTTWDELGQTLFQAQITGRFAQTWMDPGQLTLTELPTLIGSMDDLWRKLKPEGLSLLSPLGKRHHVQEILEQWIIACLCHHGFTLKITPGQALQLERGPQSVQPAQLLQQAMAGQTSHTALAALLA